MKSDKQLFLKQYYQFCPHCQRQYGENDFKDNAAVCPKCGFVVYNNPAPAVGVIIVQNKQMLLAKRAVKPFKNDWDLPGGFVEVGESSIEACQRELKEEADIEIEVISHVGSYSDQYQDYPTLVMGFIAEIKKGTIKAADDVSEFKWFALNQLPKNIAFASINQIIKDYLSHSNLAKPKL